MTSCMQWNCGHVLCGSCCTETYVRIVLSKKMIDYFPEGINECKQSHPDIGHNNCAIPSEIKSLKVKCTAANLGCNFINTFEIFCKDHEEQCVYLRNVRGL